MTQKLTRGDQPDVIRLECSDEALGARTPLTPAEREVAWKMAIGLRDRDIAQASDASLRTVNTHVRSVLAKCEIASRAELAVRVASHFARAAKESGRK